MKKIAILFFSIIMLVGCSKPLPSDKWSYIGEWVSDDMYLLILPDGSVSYERVKEGASTSINAPLQEFIGDDFTVGFGFLNTKFIVYSPPYESGGEWFMVVDGVKLVKVDG
ncbi:hypothetical protein [Photobacterium aquae]|nr:hypothetical protein [Photobacterium aquae]